MPTGRVEAGRRQCRWLLLAIAACLFVWPVRVASSPPFCLNANWTAGPAVAVAGNVSLEIDNWDTHILVTRAAKILIEEAMGTPVVLHCEGLACDAGSAIYQRVAERTVDANMEAWAGSKQAARSQWLCKYRTGPCAVEQFHTYTGSSAQTFAASPTGVTVPDQDYWKRYMTSSTPAMQALPPPDFTAPGYDREVCTKQICSADGRFYPTVCGGSAQGLGTSGNSTTAAAAGCKAYFHGSSSWDEMLVEAAIESKGLRLVVTYLGRQLTNLTATISGAHAAGHNAALFYHWKPSLFLAGKGYTHVHIPKVPSFCEDAWGQGISKCTPEEETLTKLVNPQLGSTMPKVAALIGSFALSDMDVESLLQQHPGYSSSIHNTTEMAACAWLRDNEATWGPWVLAARAVSTGPTGSEGTADEDDANMVIIVLVATLAGSAFIIGMFWWSFRASREAKDLRKQNSELTRTASVRYQTQAERKESWMIKFEEIQIGEELGRGGFGSVYKGFFRGCDVAIKMIHKNKLGIGGKGVSEGDERSGETLSTDKGSSNGDSTDHGQVYTGESSRSATTATTTTTNSDERMSEDTVEGEARTAIEREMMLLSELRHPNCIMLMGACKHNSEWVLVTEYMKGGSLADILASNPVILEPMNVKLSILLDCAQGLSYLHHATPPSCNASRPTP